VHALHAHPDEPPVEVGGDPDEPPVEVGSDPDEPPVELVVGPDEPSFELAGDLVVVPEQCLNRNPTDSNVNVNNTQCFVPDSRTV